MCRSIQVLGGDGPAPSQCSSDIMKVIAQQHMDSPSIWAVLPLQARQLTCVSCSLCPDVANGVQTVLPQKALVTSCTWPDCLLSGHNGTVAQVQYTSSTRGDHQRPHLSSALLVRAHPYAIAWRGGASFGPVHEAWWKGKPSSLL